MDGATGDSVSVMLWMPLTLSQMTIWWQLKELHHVESDAEYLQKLQERNKQMELAGASTVKTQRNVLKTEHLPRLHMIEEDSLLLQSEDAGWLESMKRMQQLEEQIGRRYISGLGLTRNPQLDMIAL